MIKNIIIMCVIAFNIVIVVLLFKKDNNQAVQIQDENYIFYHFVKCSFNFANTKISLSSSCNDSRSFLSEAIISFAAPLFKS